jgi:hypothetical protein
VTGTNVRLNVSELEPGFEKTFLNGAASIELRAPMSSIDVIGNQFDNLGLAFKGLLLSQNDLDVCAGMSMNVPTGPNVGYQLTGSPPPAAAIVPSTDTILNQSVHLLPFVGGLWRPSDRLFVQGYIQVDVDVSGDQVIDNATSLSLGRVYDPTLLYVDLGAGYWLRRGDYSRLIPGLALMGEIHVNESVGAGATTVAGAVSNSFSLVDAVVGLHMDFSPQSNLTLGYVSPITGGPDRALNGELRAFGNYRF